MVLLLLFGFIAGAATAVSPCVLPVLPVVLSAGVTGGRRRPLGVATGLALSFTFATVALVYLISALGLPNSLLRTVSVIVLIGFGISLMVPRIGDRLEVALSRLGPTGGLKITRRQGGGFWSGMLVGGGLGFVYAPCAGPILAGVITASASQNFSTGRLAVAVAYGLGSALVLYILMIGGRRLTGRLARRGMGFQMAMGAIMVTIGLAMAGNYDTRFETAIAADLPSFLVDPTKGLESSHAAKVQLAALREYKARQDAGIKEADAGETLPDLGQAPEFKDTEHWFNTPGDKPVSLTSLRGHVVLVDFWTYTCINCIRTLPYLNAWYAKYHSKGLDIVGVHTPEFPFERSASNVASAIEQDGIHYPVAQDNEYGTWNAYKNEDWPAEYFIDAKGQIRLQDFGEGEYGAKERAIRTLLIEAGAHGLGGAAQVHAVKPSEVETTPESYLGAERGERVANYSSGTLTEGVHDFGPLATEPPPLSYLRFGGEWKVGEWGTTAIREGRLQLHFRARRVYLVMGSPGSPQPVQVSLDGQPIAQPDSGADVHEARVTVEADRLYKIVELPDVQEHTLSLEVAPGVSVYDFTFG
jgi:cytochrome c biogenesis protein CcdA/thiol-disulfide isomerase/thioredoxin